MACNMSALTQFLGSNTCILLKLKFPDRTNGKGCDQVTLITLNYYNNIYLIYQHHVLSKQKPTNDPLILSIKLLFLILCNGKIDQEARLKK